MKYNLYTDGGSRGNPGHSAVGVHCTDNTNKEVFKFKKYIGISTNNQAEYTALIEGLQLCIQKDIKDLTCFADSELMVKQLRGEYKMKNPGLKPLYENVLKLRESFNSITFNHVMREKNSVADSLVNESLDER